MHRDDNDVDRRADAFDIDPRFFISVHIRKMRLLPGMGNPVRTVCTVSYTHLTMASFFIGAMLFMIAAIIAGNAIRSLLSSRSPELDIAAFAGVFATLLLNIIVAAFEYRLGKKLKSEVLISDSLHTRGDISVSYTHLHLLSREFSFRPGRDKPFDRHGGQPGNRACRRRVKIG